MSNELAKATASDLEEKRELITSLCCKNCTRDEIELFFTVSHRMGLNPLAKQIYAVKRGSVMAIQVSIDGFRLIAERTRQYSPGKETVYAYKKDGTLLSATAYVKKMTKDGNWHEVSAVAFFDEYNGATPIWKKMPHVMLAKCAESQALRKAFPAELSGIYTAEEMEQAEIEETVIVADEPRPANMTVEEACSMVAVTMSIENDETLKAYIESRMQNTKRSLPDIVAAWSERQDAFKEYFEAWKKEQS